MICLAKVQLPLMVAPFLITGGLAVPQPISPYCQCKNDLVPTCVQAGIDYAEVPKVPPLVGKPQGGVPGQKYGDPLNMTYSDDFHPPGYKLTFHDEFEGTKLNETTWINSLAWGDRALLGNGEKQCFLERNVTVTGGYVHMTAKEERVICPKPAALQNYTSGAINSQNSFVQQYGYFVMKAKLAKGKGMWSAFWLLPQSAKWPPEIDVVEMLGDRPARIHSSFHWTDTAKKVDTTFVDLEDSSSDFHTYAVDWKPGLIVWFVDGKEVKRLEGSHVPNEPMYIIANLAVGGHWPGQPDATTTFPQALVVDYIRVYQAPKEFGVYGRGPLSGLPWFSGNWITGADDRLSVFEAYRGRLSDVVVQSIPGNEQWFEVAGAISEAQVDAEIAQSRELFKPVNRGVFSKTSWRGHVWGVNPPSSEFRKRLIHLAWMDVIPRSASNGNGANPTLWREIKNGLADKYMFLLGRKFAALDTQFGDPVYPMTFDFVYEWNLTSHPSFPGGTYVENGETKETWRDFPYGWARMVKVFKEGYAYQRGKPCPYRFSWRPILRFTVRDKDGKSVNHERMWPNDIADWNIPADVKIGEMTVLPKGPIGKQADILSVSWHDGAAQKVKGATLTEPGSTWAAILKGTGSVWGFQSIADFARAKQVPLALPEWGALRADHEETFEASPHPGDFYRFTKWYIEQNLDVIAYEAVFDQGTGDLRRPWSAAQPSHQDPIIVYKELFGPPVTEATPPPPAVQIQRMKK